LAVHAGTRGARVLVTARRREALEETAAAVEQAGGVCRVYVSDLSKLETLKALVTQLEADGEHVDILINNAADVTSKPLLETEPVEIDHQVRTNVTGTMQLVRLLAPGMVERKRGMIVNVSSLAGYKPNPAQTVYSVSKAAVNAISDALEAEFRRTGIHVMNVALPSVGAGAGQIPVDRYVARLERAIRNGEREVFLSPASKWLMRLYKCFPFLARAR
jgi:short-subunit dehydrogenase